jgi:hypothetical protein
MTQINYVCNSCFRKYNAPHQADLWNHFQDKVRQQEGCSDVVIAALQLYSDKTQVAVKGGNVY